MATAETVSQLAREMKELEADCSTCGAGLGSVVRSLLSGPNLRALAILIVLFALYPLTGIHRTSLYSIS